MENRRRPIVTILAFAKRNGVVKTSSFNSHLSSLKITGDSRKGTLDALVFSGYLVRSHGAGVVYEWRITPAGEDYLRRAGIVTPEQVRAASVPASEGGE